VWTCPRCNQKFLNKNQSHSCGLYSVEGFLKGKSAVAVALFRKFVSVYKTIGPYELHPVKTRVALLTQIRFASVNRLGPNYLDGHFVLTRRLPDESIVYRIDNLNDRLFVHHFRIYKPEAINAKFKKYMRMAYLAGRRNYIGKRAKRVRAQLRTKRPQ